MNRRALLASFLAAPVAVRLGRWTKPAPFEVNEAGMVVLRPGQRLQAALAYAAAVGAWGVFVARGHHEYLAMPTPSHGPWDVAMARLDADPNLGHVNVEGGGVVCRGV